jgi:hypothetical protein
VKWMMNGDTGIMCVYDLVAVQHTLDWAWPHKPITLNKGG